MGKHPWRLGVFVLATVCLHAHLLLSASAAVAMGMCWFPPCDEPPASQPPVSHVVARIGAFESPSRITITTGGVLYVSDTKRGVVAIYGTDGFRVGTLQGVGRPLGVAVRTSAGSAPEAQGPTRVWVADESAGSVHIFENGETAGYLGTGSGEFSRPNGVAATSEHVYVVDSEARSVLVYDMAGSYITFFGSAGNDDGHFAFPTDIVINEEAGEIYVADFANRRISVFSLTGVWLRDLYAPANDSGDPIFSEPSGLGIDDDGTLYVVDAALSCVVVMDRTGGLLDVFGYQNGAYWTGELEIPIDAASDGVRVYVTSSKQRRVNVFELTSAIVCGDDIEASTEECDDGNAIDGDCCSSTCQLEALGAPCDDQNACTTADSCNGTGGCLSGPPLPCDDGDTCTIDTCSPSSGCLHVNGTPPCDYSTGCTTAARCAPVAPLGPFVRYDVRDAQGSPKSEHFGPVGLANVFATAGYEVHQPTGLLLPADQSGTGIDDPTTHLQEYKIRLAKGQPRFKRLPEVEIYNPCSSQLLVLRRKPASLMVPAAKDLTKAIVAPDSATHNVDPFVCYRAKRQWWLANGTRLPRFRRGTQLEVNDGLNSRRYDLERIRRLCVPTGVAEYPQRLPVILTGRETGTPKQILPTSLEHPEQYLVCYEASLANRVIPQQRCGCDEQADPHCLGESLDAAQTKNTAVRSIHVSDQFGVAMVDTIPTRPVQLCIPTAPMAP